MNVRKLRWTLIREADFSSTNMTAPYEIKIIQKEEKKEIIEFMRKYFMPDEPINTSINLVTAEKPFNEPLEEFLIEGYDSGVSLKAEQKGKLIAICISLILERNQKHGPAESDNRDFLTIYNFLNYIDEQCDAFKEFPDSDKAITISILAVHPSYRGLGIARDMMTRTLNRLTSVIHSFGGIFENMLVTSNEMSLELSCNTKEIAPMNSPLHNLKVLDREAGKQNGCGFMVVGCSSHFTALALQKLNFECIYRLPYEDYKVDDKVVFKTEPPHDAATVYVKKIN